MQNVLKEFGLQADSKTKNQLTNLYQIPKKDKGVNAPTFSYPVKESTAQADLLFMPDDKGFKYALVVVDNGTRLLDAEPIKTKDSSAVIAAFVKIFKRKNVAKPKRIEVDAGSEFKSGTAKYFKDNNIKVRVAEVGRHRMQSLVEKANHHIGSILHKRMTAQELITGQVSKEWTADLPLLVKVLNKYIKKREADRIKKVKKGPKVYDEEPRCSGDACKLLSVGDHVRVALEFPIDVVTGAKLHGKFRSSDIRFNPKVRIIRELLLTPNQPPMYLLDGDVGDMKITPVAYTKAQLQLIDKSEKMPNVKVIRGKPKQWIVERIVDKKKIKNKIHYLVHWQGFPDAENTWEPLTSLKKEVPALVKEYEDKV